jgi:glycosyltransferase involved in cell wall biosynthesis
MTVLIINRFYWPDESATAVLAADLAEDLAAAGHEVHVLCSRLSVLRPAARAVPEETRRGVRIHRLFSCAFGRAGFSRRLADLLSFHLFLRLRGPAVCRPHVVFVMTDPPLAATAALYIARRHDAPVVQHVDDVYPDVAVALGQLRPRGLPARLSAEINRRAMTKCARLLALSGRMAAILRGQGLPAEKITVLPPWADGRLLRPVPHAENSFRRELDRGPDDFVVMYAGNMGRCHPFDAILAGAEALAADQRVRFVFVGDGAQRPKIEAFMRRRPAARIQLLPYQPRARLAEVLSAGDVHLITQDARTDGLIVPSKLAGILAVGRPVVFVGPSGGDLADTLTARRCGFVVSETDEKELARCLQSLRDDPALRADVAARARLTFAAEYDRAAVVPRLIAALEAVRHEHEAR